MTEPPRHEHPSTSAQELGRIIATIDARNGYGGLLDAFIVRMNELETCISSVDTVAGLPEDYTGKVLRGIRSVGPASLGPLLGALRGKLLFVPDDTADYKINRGLNRLRKRGTKGPKLRTSAAVNAGERKGRKGLVLRAWQLNISSSAQRSMTARIAACARWQKHRAKQAKLARRRELRRKLMEATGGLK